MVTLVKRGLNGDKEIDDLVAFYNAIASVIEPARDALGSFGLSAEDIKTAADALTTAGDILEPLVTVPSVIFSNLAIALDPLLALFNAALDEPICTTDIFKNYYPKSYDFVCPGGSQNLGVTCVEGADPVCNNGETITGAFCSYYKNPCNEP